MKRTPLVADPETTRAWQQRSNERAAERARVKPRRRLPAIGAAAKRRQRLHDEWRRLVFERDGGRCRFPHHLKPEVPCGGPLDPHHVIPKGVRADLRFEPNNGRVLCRNGHDYIESGSKAHAWAFQVGLKAHSWETVEHGVVLR